MPTGYRFRAYPDQAVARVLLRWIGCQRFIKNAKVREDRYFRAFKRRFPEFAGQHAPIDQSYSHLIGEGGGAVGSVPHEANTLWLREVPSQILRNGAVRFMQGYQRFFKGLARRPTITKPHGEQSVWITSELFQFLPVLDADQKLVGHRLQLGTKAKPIGELPFVVHKGCESWQPPASIHVSVHAGRWHVSFSNEIEEEGKFKPTAQDTLDHLRTFSAEDLLPLAVGLDRGVAVPLMAAGVNGPSRAFDLSDVQKERLAHKEVRRKRHQRRVARKHRMGKAQAAKAGVRYRPSKNLIKARLKAARCTLYAANVREDFAHQTSRALVNSDALLFVFEDLKVKNMTASAAGTLDKPGKHVAQKSGLNRSILGSAWGITQQFTQYKALDAGKLCIQVPPHHSSQECAACGHVHPDNRSSQDRFVCLRCGQAENADTNAARVIARRGVNAVVLGSYTLRKVKKVGGLRPAASAKNKVNPVGPEGPELTPVETTVRLGALARAQHVSLKQETPTTATAGA